MVGPTNVLPIGQINKNIQEYTRYKNHTQIQNTMNKIAQNCLRATRNSLELVICKILAGMLFKRNGELMKNLKMVGVIGGYSYLEMSRADGFDG